MLNTNIRAPEPTNEFYYGVIDLLFKAPAVVLEHSDYFQKARYSDNQLFVDFTSAFACDFAKQSWPKGTIIVSSTAGCKARSDDDQCYFKVEDTIKSEDGKSIIIKGYPQARDECTEGGEAHWGRYKPEKNGSVKQPNGTATYSNSTSSPTPRPSPSGNPLTNSTDTGDSKFDQDIISDCKAPVDTKYNLPTTCTGQYFDLDLDEFMGYGELSAEDKAFLKDATAGLSSDEISGLARRALMHNRQLARRNIVKKLFKKYVVEPIKTTIKVGKAVASAGYELVTTGGISGSIKESFKFALPDGDKADAKQVESPWGPAALIAAYGKESKIKADKGVQVDGYLNIYCVGCGAQGSVELAGRAKWVAGSGITQGEIEAWADLKVAMKVGVDAQIKLTREWKKTLYQKGLPKLSFGPIIIGPQVRVDARVTLEAGAEGRILAGAEYNWNRAYAKIDMIDSSKSTRQNFDPVGHPTLEAEGTLFVGAELGLPIGMHFGVTVSGWSKTVGLINEPMVKGIAKAAVRAELVDGKISAGFTLTEGCQGIHTNLSFRNKLTCNILDLKEFELLDSGYKSIKSMCIPLGKQAQQPSTPASGEETSKDNEGESGNDTGNSEGGSNGETSNGEGTTEEGAGGPPTEGQSTDELPTVEPSTDEQPTGEPPSGELPAEQGSTEEFPSQEDNTGDNNAQSTGDNNTQGGSEDGGSSGEDASVAADKERSMSARQITTTPAPSSSEDLPTGIREITDSVKKATDNVNYALADIKTVPYERTDGYEFTKLTAGDYSVMYCSNGNMYVKKAGALTSLGCDELFAYSDDAVVGDGQGRYFYYHDDAMKAAGVSRLRLGDEESPVLGTSAVAMVAWKAEMTENEYDADLEGIYTVVDFEIEATYWLSFCTYKDGQAPKVFVVANLDTGLAVLESPDVKYSITGGDVDKCLPLMTVEDPALKDTWAEWDDSMETDADGLEFDVDEFGVES